MSSRFARQMIFAKPNYLQMSKSHFSTTTTTPTSTVQTNNASGQPGTIPPVQEEEKKTIWSYLRFRYFVMAFAIGGAYWFLKRTRRQQYNDRPDRHYLLPIEYEAFAELALLTSEEMQACVDASVYVPPKSSSFFNPFKPASQQVMVSAKAISVETFEKKVKFLVEKNRRRREKIRAAVREAEAKIEDEVRMELSLPQDSSLAPVVAEEEKTVVPENTENTLEGTTYCGQEALTAKFEDWYDDIDSDEAPFHSFEANILLRPCRILGPGLVNYYDASASATLVSADMYDPRDPRDPLYMSPEKLNAPESSLTEEELKFKKLRAEYVKVRSHRYYDTRKRLDSHPIERVNTFWDVCTKPKKVAPVKGKPVEAEPEQDLDKRAMDYTRFIRFVDILLKTGHFDESVTTQSQGLWPVKFACAPVDEVAKAYYKQLCKSEDQPISLEEFKLAAYQLALKRQNALWYLDPSKLSTFSDLQLWRRRKAMVIREWYRDMFGPKPVVIEIEKINTPEHVKGSKPWSKF